jgi:di/tricarboxylate transporter
MTENGAASHFADGLVRIVQDACPRALLVRLFLLTAVLGQAISNMAPP